MSIWVAIYNKTVKFVHLSKRSLLFEGYDGNNNDIFLGKYMNRLLLINWLLILLLSRRVVGVCSLFN